MPIRTECNLLDQFHYLNPGSMDRHRPVGIGPRFSKFCWYWSGPRFGIFSRFKPGPVPGFEIFRGPGLIRGSLIWTQKLTKVWRLCVPEFSQSMASEIQPGYIDVSNRCWSRNMLVTSLRCSWPIYYIEKVTNKLILSLAYENCSHQNNLSRKPRDFKFLLTLTQNFK